MKNFFCTLTLLLSALITFNLPAQQSPVDHVNMMIGTTGAHRSGYGGLVPEVSTPFGMTKWCAATRLNMISKRMYHYDDSVLIGYMGTHQPVVWMGDYGFLTIMPQMESLKVRLDERAVPFSYEGEVSTPYYYRNYIRPARGIRITTEIAATSRSAFFKFTYDGKGEPILFLEATREDDPNEGAWGYTEIIPERNEVRIYNTDHQEDNHLGPELKNFKGYYVLKFDKPFTRWGTWQEDYGENEHQEGLRGGLEANRKEGNKKEGNKKEEKNSQKTRVSVQKGNRIFEGSHSGGYVKFNRNTELVQVRIGSSFISFEQATENLEREIQEGKSFEMVMEDTKKDWNEMLGRVTIETGNPDDRTLFYSMLLRTLQYPREITEYGRYYSAFDGQVHEGISYNAFSLWDTFRSQHPWLQIIAPERVEEMMQALVQMYEQGGWMPKWPNLTYTNSMIGTHGDIVIADAWMNGFRNFDIKTALASMMKNAFVPPLGNDDWKPGKLWTYEAKAGLPSYLKNGYVAADVTRQSVSRTLEFALDDYCLAQLAKNMGKVEEYKLFTERSKNYRNLFNPETERFDPRNYDRSWTSDMVVHRTYTEGRYWTYMFCVMQDVPDLIDLMGGEENFIRKLDENFDEGHYKHDNEPGQHYAYLYNYAGMHEKTQQRVRTII